MSSETMTPERALLRLQQLAREERQAIAADDVDALCRITELLPSALEALTRGGLKETPALREAIEEIQATHTAAELYLTAHLAAVADALQRCSAARRASGAYARGAGRGIARLNELS